MDADFTNGSGSSPNSRQESYRLTHSGTADSGSSANPALTGIDTGAHATLGRTTLDQPEQPVQWSSPLTRRSAEAEPPQRRSVQDFAAAPRLSTPEVDTGQRRSVQDFGSAPDLSVPEVDTRRTAQDLESSRRAAQDLEASLRRAAEFESASRRVAPEVDSVPARSAPDLDSAPRRAAPDVDPAPRRAAPDVDSAPRRAAADVDSVPRRGAPDPESPSRRAAPDRESSAHRSAPDTESISRRINGESTTHRIAPELNSTPRRDRDPAPQRIAADPEPGRHQDPAATSRRAAPEPELAQPISGTAGARAREFRAEDAPNIDLHHIMRLLVASHDLDVAAAAAESGEVAVADLTSAARRTRAAVVDLVAAWYGGPDHMRRFGEVLLQAAAETA